MAHVPETLASPRGLIRAAEKTRLSYATFMVLSTKMMKLGTLPGT